MTRRTDDELIRDLMAQHSRVGHELLKLFELIREAQRAQVWEDWGARDLPHLLSVQLGISWWKAHRWVQAARALAGLPRLSEALASGELGADKVVELARFATPEDEERLIRWATGVSVAAVRRRAEVASRPRAEDAAQPEEARTLQWWSYDDGRRFGLLADLPAADGAVVARVIERLAERVPAIPGEEHPHFADKRRADALVALCSGALARDPDPDRATVVVHASLQALASADQSCELEGGGVIHPETARRLACHSRVQVILEDAGGNPVRVGRLRREPPGWMLRQLRYRDRECRFPSCGARQFLHAHHIRWWEHGGRTDLDNLVLICTFHHKLVHEHGWRLQRDPDNSVGWYRPDGRRYGAGPAPPGDPPRALAIIAEK